VSRMKVLFLCMLQEGICLKVEVVEL
jgi:hypothetical protein